MQLLIRTPSGYYRTPTAIVVGHVTIGPDSTLWFHSVVRGDVAPITIGARTNIQDGAVIHADTDRPNLIEDDITIGHGAIVHGDFVGRGSLIGMGARVLGHTHIGRECLVAAGAVVPPGMQVPDRSVVMGTPARIVRTVNEEDLKYMRFASARYIELIKQYQQGDFPPGTFVE